MIPATARPSTRSPLHGRRVSALELCALARVTLLAVAVEIAIRVLPLPVVARALRVSLSASIIATSEPIAISRTGAGSSTRSQIACSWASNDGSVAAM
jgi:hypothetical protein